MALQASPPGPLTPSDRGIGFFFYEQELTNILKSGRVWLGESMNSSRPTLSLSFSDLPAFDSLYLRIQLAASSFTPVQIAAEWGGIALGSASIAALPGPFDNFQARWGTLTRALYNVPASPTLRLSYSGAGQGYLDFVEGVGWFRLAWSGGQRVFYLPAGADWSVTVQAATIPLLWDVTDALRPEIVPTASSAGGFTFAARGDTLRRFCAFVLSAAYTIRPVGTVPNQNLHSLSGFSFIIATTAEQLGLPSAFVISILKQAPAPS